MVCTGPLFVTSSKKWDSGTIPDQHIEHSWTNIPEMLQYLKLAKPTTEWHILMTQIPFHGAKTEKLTWCLNSHQQHMHQTG
jgi:hypothetical protein